MGGPRRVDLSDRQGLFRPRENVVPCLGVPALLVEKYPRTESSPVARATSTVDDDDIPVVVVRLDDATHRLSHTEARALRTSLDDALRRTEEFVHTVGEHRPDGTYVVSRRRADSAGHRKVFDAFGTLCGLYDDLPETFTAVDVEGVSGGRRHMLVWHLVEHPAFDCRMVSKQPLTARKG
ncbi:DUF7528 family protein [Halomarina ordinaria]|uniref:Uncharacterized protein n=1 Tax=Halomarina ordinaria TaxID=3033939 RepID=A0ABD5U7S1_9EURY|nr:hypothetical protein [Halomarina sp. PSRA2]